MGQKMIGKGASIHELATGSKSNDRRLKSALSDVAKTSVDLSVDLSETKQDTQKTEHKTIGKGDLESTVDHRMDAFDASMDELVGSVHDHILSDMEQLSDAEQLSKTERDDLQQTEQKTIGKGASIHELATGSKMNLAFDTMSGLKGGLGEQKGK